MASLRRPSREGSPPALLTLITFKHRPLFNVAFYITQDEVEIPGEGPADLKDQLNKNEKISTQGQIRREGMKRKEFGLSLILSNVPRSPNFINGSFAALFDTNDIIMDYARQLSRKSLDFNGRPIRLSPRKRLKEQSKQYSFDLSLMPGSRKRLQPYKQGSLDSKIEEIFDTTSVTSADSTSENEYYEEGKALVFGFVEKEDKAVQSPPQAETQYEHPKENGIHIYKMKPVVCKHCGHIVQG